MRTIAVLTLLAASVTAQTTTLSGNGQQSGPGGTLTTVAVAITFHENPSTATAPSSVSVIVNVGGCSAAVSIPLTRSRNGIRYYKGRVETCGMTFDVSALLGHDQGPISTVTWGNGGSLAGQAVVN